MRRLPGFHPAIQDWFGETFGEPTRAQSLAWTEIASGRSTLVAAPTGSGKTLAAFLAAIDRLMFAPAPPKNRRCRVLYVSPLRALAVDVERNLRAPLAGIASLAAGRADSFHVPAMAIRTGDTPARERAAMRRSPPDILITTPESLFLILTSEARSILASLEVVIVDEVHTLVGTKRGAHLALSLERVHELSAKPPQRIGLSATLRPLDVAARYLGGCTVGKTVRPRPVSIVDAGAKKRFDLRVEVAVEDMARLDDVAEPLSARPTFVRELTPTSRRSAGAERAEGDATEVKRRSIWPAIHPRLLELIRAHRSTLLFVNSRRLAERLAAALNELAGEALVRAHHGSIAREQRLEIEDGLKAGRLPAIVATSSLELGIDMGAVDLVVQIETPPSVASGVQRIGRASHQIDAVSRGIIFPKFRGDLLATAAITEAMEQGAVEPTRMPRNPLDVLAQQIVSVVATGERPLGELYALARGAAPFADLPRRAFESVLDMLSGRYPSDEFAELRPRLTWDRTRHVVRAREGVRRLVVFNAGTIPDRGLYGVFLADGDEDRRKRGGLRVGELDEEMVFESFVGDVIVLGATSWRIVNITRDRVLVEPAPGEPGRLPFWKADRPPRPVDLGRAIGVLTRELLAAPKARAVDRLIKRHRLDAAAAENLVAYLKDQREAAGAVPDDTALVLERSRDEMGDHRLCLLSPWGGRVHAPWALAIQAKLRAEGQGEAETVWSDDGIVIRMPESDHPPDAAVLLPDPEDIERLVVAELGGSALFAGYFREAAGRALLLPRRRPGQRSPLWMQRKRAHDLLKVAAKYGSFPIILEAYRECLQDVFDLPSLVDLARRVRRREIHLTTVDTQSPSPFAAALLFGYVANYLYEGDAPLAERRANALAIDQSQLKELLGESECRDLLDPRAVAEVEESLQGLAPGRGARSADAIHDLLLRLGDLTLEEITARVEPAEDRDARVGPWLEGLVKERRIVRVDLGERQRFIAVEDAGRARDAFGAALPAALPGVFLESTKDPLATWLLRYARTHGPFDADALSRRYAIDAGAVARALDGLAVEGRLLSGGFRPGSSGREWCDGDVLKRLRQRSLARLRRQAEPVEAEVYARFLVGWQGASALGAPATRSGTEAILDAVEQLQSASFAASILEDDVLRARVPEYRPADLDLLCGAGEVVWVGRGPLGEGDGRVSLYLADDLDLLWTPLDERPRGAVHDRIREHLGKHGASYFAEIHDACGAALHRETLDALWDLVWSSEVRNDSIAALRAFLGGRSSAHRRRRFPGTFRSRRETPLPGAGRWSLLDARSKATPTQRALARAEQLLARHGVLTRDGVAAENVPGGFASVYPLLKTLEESGRVRRGYFVAGLGGLQFADPGAVERLRASRDDAGPTRGVVLAAADPANPYGAALPWPKDAAGRAQRAAGAHVLLVDGRLVASLGRGEGELSLFLPADEPLGTRVAGALATALATWSRATGRVTIGWAPSTDGASFRESTLLPHLVAAGFEPWGPGLRLQSPGASAGAPPQG